MLTQPRFLRTLQLAVCLLLASEGGAYGQLESTPITSVQSQVPGVATGALRLRGGDLFRGRIARATRADAMAWSSPSFLDPVEFGWENIDQIVFPVATKTQTEILPRAFCVELQDGTLVSGSLESIAAQSVTLNVPELGLKTIPSTAIRHILRLSSPSGNTTQVLAATDWEQVLPATKNGTATKWYLKAGEISTDVSGTTITQWAQLPELATLEIDVAWNQKSPNFWMTLGEPRRLELQVRKLQNKKLLNVTLLLENTKDADVVTAQLPYEEEEESLVLKLLCDANKGTYVLMKDNLVLGRLKGNPSERFIGRNKVSFTNTALGLLTLRELRISSSAFALPSDTSVTRSESIEFMTRERGTFFGSMEPTGEEFEFKVIGVNNTETTIRFDELERIEFPAPTVVSPPVSAPQVASGGDSAAPSPAVSAATTLELLNGLRYASNSVASDHTAVGIETGSQGAVILQILDQPLRFPLESIRRIEQHHRGTPDSADASATAAQSVPRNIQRLITDDVASLGNVESVVTTPSGTRTLSWRARHATGPVPLHPQIDGVIESEVAITATDTTKKSREGVGGIRNRVGVVMMNSMEQGEEIESQTAKALKPNDPSVFLVSGDCFPGTVLGGDADVFQFESPLFPKKEIAASLVRGFRLVEYRGADNLDRLTRNRLLTLPRVQRKNPPTHVVVSRDGDLLRGRVIRLDRDELLFEVRGEERKILMKNVAELIWVDAPPKAETNPETPDDTQVPAPVTSADASTETSSVPAPEALEPVAPIPAIVETPTVVNEPYQILLDHGARVSILPDSIDDESFRGTHPQLGECVLPWSSIQRISLGSTIRIDSSRSRFGKWKLQNAPDPKYMNEEEGESNDRPNDTPQMRLIGQEAPEFDLQKLDGTPGQLSDYQGKIVILDFWASWCGPCIRSMPELIALSREYHDLGVELLFVNVEESEDRIRTFLERVELNPTVVLDRDGSVSKQYAVQAIPQTVLIDREGVLVKILVGASQENEAELRKQLDELTGKASK
jgi:thiol-disulfide isomerase/thioredoxin